MKTAWTEAAWHDYLHWSHADERMRARIDELICDINGVPFKGGDMVIACGAWPIARRGRFLSW